MSMSKAFNMIFTKQNILNDLEIAKFKFQTVSKIQNRFPKMCGKIQISKITELLCIVNLFKNKKHIPNYHPNINPMPIQSPLIKLSLSSNHSNSISHKYTFQDISRLSIPTFSRNLCPSFYHFVWINELKIYATTFCSTRFFEIRFMFMIIYILTATVVWTAA